MIIGRASICAFGAEQGSVSVDDRCERMPYRFGQGPSSDVRRRQTPQRARRHRRFPPRVITQGRVPLACAIVFALLGVAGLAWLAGDQPSQSSVRAVPDGLEVQAPAHSLPGPMAQQLAGWVASVPPARTETRGSAQITYAIDHTALNQAAGRVVRAGGGTITLPQQPIASHIPAPVIRQAYSNNCEIAGLSMLLASRNVSVDQYQLTREIPRSGPPQMQPGPAGIGTWGDPNQGFVGDPANGGFGVYQGPIRTLAAAHGVRLHDLSGRPAAEIYNALLAGRAVEAWAALGEGPFQTWQAPSGRQITGNWGEHAVVLAGVDRDSVSLNDPLTGQVLTWSKAEFETRWQQLGQRALAL